jgi:hypothetical protein
MYKHTKLLTHSSCCVLDMVTHQQWSGLISSYGGGGGGGG